MTTTTPRPYTDAMRLISALAGEAITVPWAWITATEATMDERLRIGVDALQVVESEQSDGFRKLKLAESQADLPVLLYERHILWDVYQDRSRVLLPSALYSKKRTPATEYGTYRDQWLKLLTVARVLSWDLAVQACSWGRYQVLGKNWAFLGCDGPSDFAWAMFYPEGQRAAMIRYVRRVPGLAEALRTGDGHAVGRLYNGKNYAASNYHGRWRAAWEQIGNSVGKTA